MELVDSVETVESLPSVYLRDVKAFMLSDSTWALRRRLRIKRCLSSVYSFAKAWRFCGEVWSLSMVIESYLLAMRNTISLGFFVAREEHNKPSNFLARQGVRATVARENHDDHYLLLLENTTLR